MTPDNEQPHPLPTDLGREIFRCQVGSGVHGVLIGGTDDRDEMGLCIERADYVVGLRMYERVPGRWERFEQYIYRTKPEGARSGPGDLDLVVYSLRKWMRLALAGNPTVLLPLFVPPSEVVIDSVAWWDLRRRSEWFLSRQTADRFLGYMVAQREQLLGLRGKKHTNRPELVHVHGFDTKFAYHMVRLGLQGVELLTTGRITLPIPEPDRTWLRELREGKYPIGDALARALELESQLLALRSSADLPESPAFEGPANRWLIDVYTQEWTSGAPR